MSEPEFDYLGPYKVERTIGRGGMGSVYKGFHSRSGEPIAIKVIAPAVANSPRFRRRFAAEVETLQRLKHPNIVSLVGFGEEQGLLFYTMEYVDGQSLHEYLRQNKKMPWQDAIDVAIETAAALKHAHDLGIIHRDLKPANLMVASDGRVKLTDFGIAKLFGATELTAAGSVIGTADYMPPEQAEGKAVTVRSDLYSLGGVLYALICGQAPFTGKSVPEVLYAVRYNSAPNLQEREPDVPDELSELVHELLDKSPSKRPPTALVVGNRLKSIKQGYAARQQATSGKPAAQTPESEDSAKSTPTNVTGFRKMGTHLTSLDLSDIEEDEVQLTGEEIGQLRLEGSDGEQSDAPRSGDSLATHEQQTMVAPEDLELPPAGPKSEGLHSRRESEFSGEFPQPASAAPDDEEPLTSGGPSHYTPIEEADSKPYGFAEKDTDESEGGPDWLQIGSIAGIVVTLLASIALGWYWLQPGSADQLYQSIQEAVDSGDEVRLSAAKGQIETFLDRFGEDERALEVEALRDEIELSRWTRVLQRRASRAGGEANMSAIEQAFLECMQLRQRAPDVAEPHMRAFLSVYGPLKDLPPRENRYVELIDFALRIGERQVADEEPPAADDLEKLIQSADNSLSGDELSEYYKDLMTLYGDKEWAREQISRLRRKLQEE